MKLATALSKEGIYKGREPLVRARGIYKGLSPCSCESFGCLDHAKSGVVASQGKT
jgi:hypothetical protein